MVLENEVTAQVKNTFLKNKPQSNEKLWQMLRNAIVNTVEQLT